MSLMALLKKGSLPGRATAIPATFATDAPLPLPKVAKVATVAVANAPDSAANDTGAPWRVSVAPGTPPDALERMRAASLALDQAQAATHHDPEAWLERAAIAEFDGGQTRQDAEAMADLFDAYHGHHFNCPTCISAGRGYGQRCATGLPLWVAYQTDPEPTKGCEQ